jgi:hypothetical protein
VIGRGAPVSHAARDDRQRHAALVVGEDCVDVDVQGPLGDLHELAEQAVDGVPAAVVTLDLIPASGVEQHIVGEQVAGGGEVTLGEGSVGVP